MSTTHTATEMTTTNGTQGWELTDENGNRLGWAVPTNPRCPEELTLTRSNGLTLCAVATTLDRAAELLADVPNA